LNMLSAWSRAILEKLIITQLVKRLPSSYETRRFSLVFKSSRQFRGTHKLNLTYLPYSYCDKRYCISLAVNFKFRT